MEQEHEEGLIGIYLSQISALGVKALKGEEIASEVESVVAKACSHFEGVKSSPANANLKAFRGRLKIQAESVHESQPEMRQTLEYAASCCPEKI